MMALQDITMNGINPLSIVLLCLVLEEEEKKKKKMNEKKLQNPAL